MCVYLYIHTHNLKAQKFLLWLDHNLVLQIFPDFLQEVWAGRGGSLLAIRWGGGPGCLSELARGKPSCACCRLAGRGWLSPPRTGRCLLLMPWGGQIRQRSLRMTQLVLCPADGQSPASCLTPIYSGSCHPVLVKTWLSLSPCPQPPHTQPIGMETSLGDKSFISLHVAPPLRSTGVEVCV